MQTNTQPEYELLEGEKELWRGRQWVVTTHVVQPFGEQQDYFINIDRLAEVRSGRNGGTCSDWLLHLAMKNWIDLEDFITAWCIAVLIHKTKLGKIDVAKSIEKARKLKRQADEDVAKRRQQCIDAGIDPDGPVIWSFKEGDLYPRALGK